MGCWATGPLLSPRLPHPPRHFPHSRLPAVFELQDGPLTDVELGMARDLVGQEAVVKLESAGW